MDRALVFINYFVYFLIIAGMIILLFLAGHESSAHSPKHELILSSDGYSDSHLTSTWKQITHRATQQPFNLISLIIFACAVIHTFFASKITQLADWIKKRNGKGQAAFLVEILHFMGEVEVIFGIWTIPLIVAMSIYYDWSTALHYLNGIDYNEAMLIVVIMALASTAPIVALAEKCLKSVAKLGSGSVQAWWWSILTLAPLLGSLITEPAAMTIAALMLSKQFYSYQPSRRLAYATLGLLFTNISVGGAMTNFAAPPVLIVSKTWNWSTSFMFTNFGMKALIGILIANFLYYFIFRKEFSQMEAKRKEQAVASTETKDSIPLWVTITNVFFLAWIVVHAHYPVIYIGSFLLFLGFYRATSNFQATLDLKPAILVGLFLAGLLVHGSLQAWWISPLLSKASKEALMAMSMVLTAFNDNAEITFLASLIPNFDASLKYAVVSGALAGGGLTLIANAPNLTGQSILYRFFYPGISTLHLFLGALVPAIVMGFCFYFLGFLWKL